MTSLIILTSKWGQPWFDFTDAECNFPQIIERMNRQTIACQCKQKRLWKVTLKDLHTFICYSLLVKPFVLPHISLRLEQLVLLVKILTDVLGHLGEKKLNKSNTESFTESHLNLGLKDPKF